MKSTILLLLSIPIFSFTALAQDSNWTPEHRAQRIKDRQDPAKWDIPMFEQDQEMAPIISQMDIGPFCYGVYPEPKYELAGEGGTNGNGNLYDVFTVDDQTYFSQVFLVYANSINQSYISEGDHEIYFHLIIQTDEIDLENDQVHQSMVSSRNHPDYLGQGFLQVSNARIDYCAFITAERDQFAIVNGRLFDLNYGKTIIIKTMEDGTLRSYQHQSNVFSGEFLETETHQIVSSEEVQTFFEQ